MYINENKTFTMSGFPEKGTWDIKHLTLTQSNPHIC